MIKVITNDDISTLLKEMFMCLDATKDDYAKALRAYHVEIKSKQRDEADGVRTKGDKKSDLFI